jgi:hypothetical protein
MRLKYFLFVPRHHLLFPLIRSKQKLCIPLIVRQLQFVLHSILLNNAPAPLAIIKGTSPAAKVKEAI